MTIATPSQSESTTAAADTAPLSGELAPPSPEIKTKYVLIALLIMALFIVRTRLYTFDEPFDRDIMTSVLSGKLLNSGMKAYEDLLEFKPPGSFVIWQIVDRVMGTSPDAIGVVNIIVALSTLFGCYVAGAAMSGRRLGGLVAAGAWTIAGGEMMLQANQPNLEVFINTGFVWAVALLATCHPDRTSAANGLWRFFLAGLLVALVTLIKHNVVVAFVFMVGGWAVGQWDMTESPAQRRRAVMWVIAGALGLIIPWVGTIAYFASQGRAGEFLMMITSYAAHYAQTGGGDGHAKRTLTDNLIDGLTINHLIPWYTRFLAPLLLLTIIAGVLFMRRGQYGKGALIAGWIVGMFVAVAVPGTHYAHYYQLYLPALAVGAGCGLVAVAPTLRAMQMALVVGLTFFGIVLHVMPEYTFSPNDWARLKYETNLYRTTRQLGQMLGQVLEPNESMYLWGVDQGVYYYADKLPPTGIMWSHYLVFGGELSKKWTEHVVRDLERARPEIVVIEQPAVGGLYHPVIRLISSNYDYMKDADLPPFKIFYRRGGAVSKRMDEVRKLIADEMTKMRATTRPAAGAATQPAAGGAPATQSLDVPPAPPPAPAAPEPAPAAPAMP